MKGRWKDLSVRVKPILFPLSIYILILIWDLRLIGNSFFLDLFFVFSLVSIFGYFLSRKLYLTVLSIFSILISLVVVIQFIADQVFGRFLETGEVFFGVQNISLMLPELPFLLTFLDFRIVFLSFMIPPILALVLIQFWKSKSKKEESIYLPILILILLYLPNLFRGGEVNNTNKSPDHYKSQTSFGTKKFNVMIFLLEGVNSKNLDRQNSFYFSLPEARSFSPFFVSLPHSSSSLFSLLTGLEPNHNYVPRYREISGENNFLSVFQKHGYKTEIFTSGMGYFEELDKMIPYFGAELKDRKELPKLTGKKYQTFPWGIEDRALLDVSTLYSPSPGNPTLEIYLFTNTHSPYWNPEESKSKSDLFEGGLDRYRSSIKYNLGLIDSMIRLRESKIKGETIYLLTSDHGELFGEGGRYKHGHTLINEEIRVPFYILSPISIQFSNQEFGTILDIFPTLTDVLGLEYSFPTDGISLLKYSPNRTIRLKTWGKGKFGGEIKNFMKKICDTRNGDCESFNLEDIPLDSGIQK
ncbi:MAG: sulfatase-like hydrolase/transferase [Leptospiraceae bacterium]|nr:sulfatase-like hydrolase/transferase [Leptospiraceae bacterium]